MGTQPRAAPARPNGGEGPPRGGGGGTQVDTELETEKEGAQPVKPGHLGRRGRGFAVSLGLAWNGKRVFVTKRQK